MSHDVFISYATEDKTTADAICASLEASGIRCWIAPRDVVPGQDWGQAIIDALDEVLVLVLVFSSSANESDNVRDEVRSAVRRGVLLLPFRTENVEPSGPLELPLVRVHWLDALSLPLEQHIGHLVDAVRRLLGCECGDAPEPDAQASATSAEPPEDTTPTAVGQDPRDIEADTARFEVTARDGTIHLLASLQASSLFVERGAATICVPVGEVREARLVSCREAKEMGKKHIAEGLRSYATVLKTDGRIIEGTLGGGVYLRGTDVEGNEIMMEFLDVTTLVSLRLEDSEAT